jgi:hypothetical protein
VNSSFQLFLMADSFIINGGNGSKAMAAPRISAHRARKTQWREWKDCAVKIEITVTNTFEFKNIRSDLGCSFLKSTDRQSKPAAVGK